MGDKEGLLAAALERLRTATAADAAGETARAVAEYDAGVALLARAAVRARTPDERAMLCAKCAEYGARADTLRSALPAAATATVANAPSSSTTTTTTTNSEDAALEARIARLPRLGGSIPSAPDPLPPQRPQTEEEQADDLVREALESAALERRYGPPPSVSSDSESDSSDESSNSSDESSNSSDTDDDKEEDERMKREDEKEEAELQAALEVLLREPRGSPAARAAAAVVRRRLHGNTARHEAAERAYIARRTREEREREQAARARWLRKQRK